MQLAGSSWTLVEFETEKDMIAVVKDAPATLTFGAEDEQANRINGTGGCNRYFGSYTLTNDSISVSPLGATRMACSPEQMAQEDRFIQALSTATSYELRNDELLIKYSGGTLRFVPATPQV